MQTNFILDALASDPNIAPAFRAAIKTPQFFETRNGFPRRVYLSPTDAEAYDRGWSEYEFGTAPARDQGPYSDGAWDAFSAEEEKAQAALDRKDEAARDEWDAYAERDTDGDRA